MSDHDGLLATMRAMWSDMKSLNRGLNDRFDTLTERVDGLERHVVGGEIRVATELLSVATAIRELRDVLRARSPR